MNINTKYLGDVEINEEDIYYFSKGLLGFESSKEFILVDVPDNPYFKFLQDIKNSYTCFLVTNPWIFFNDYDADFPDEELKAIGINNNEEAEKNMGVFTIVTIGQDFKNSTANLLAPIVINLEEKTGKQLVLRDEEYTTKHRLYPEGAGE